ncbi:MAG: radical SAM family heme chaperone HemW [Actinomycetota bacterium]
MFYLGLGVYVHVPFCATRCDYCAFTTWTDRAHLIDDYVEACITDVLRQRATGELAAATTVYFGGGTPSLVDAEQLMRVLAAIPRAPGAEVTVECNPDSVDADAMRVYRDHGVTRVSLGVQSTQPHVLAALGRTHDRANVERAVAAVHSAGIPSLNLDVIVGSAGESAEDFDTTLTDVLAFDPAHVSVYGLTVEPGTALERRVATGDLDPPDPDVQADRYLRADERITAAGLEWYEISNWARPGHECRHNLGYWTGQDCVAIGAGAHGHARGVRWWTVPKPERYVERLRAGATPVAGEERPDPTTVASERFGLALRTRAGAPVPSGLDPARLAEVADAGLVEVGEGRIVLTRTGRLLATEVTLRLEVGTRYHGVPTEVVQVDR